MLLRIMILEYYSPCPLIITIHYSVSGWFQIQWPSGPAFLSQAKSKTSQAFIEDGMDWRWGGILRRIIKLISGLVDIVL